MLKPNCVFVCFLIILLDPQKIFASNPFCSENGEFSYIFKNTVQTKKVAYCTDGLLKGFLSGTCKTNFKKCVETQLELNHKSLAKGDFQHGTSVSKYCRQVGGTPIIIDFKNASGLVEMEVCRLSNGDMIDVFNLSLVARTFFPQQGPKNL